MKFRKISAIILLAFSSETPITHIRLFEVFPLLTDSNLENSSFSLHFILDSHYYFCVFKLFKFFSYLFQLEAS